MLSGDSSLREHPRTPAPETGKARSGLPPFTLLTDYTRGN